MSKQDTVEESCCGWPRLPVSKQAFVIRFVIRVNELDMSSFACVCVRLCVCVRACVRACVRVCVRI